MDSNILGQKRTPQARRVAHMTLSCEPAHASQRTTNTRPSSQGAEAEEHGRRIAPRSAWPAMTGTRHGSPTNRRATSTPNAYPGTRTPHTRNGVRRRFDAQGDICVIEGHWRTREETQEISRW
ncbi:hypothetical protein PHLGIDRAFT_164683 [Phlebiopsis gigantea 11061_1 CR5-6]|uniref:Uncharacterized protein n=1 Tax=Phlebiopsis gigantea (strain 11061_1 CR5-6) TaxID=745531 RepID=A0A0C3PH68_PHLG1|nr:hypothetical protein PHLGIDRAFT_164683 [Phlebiopsis gigantea 11061_1 CR5-6]